MVSLLKGLIDRLTKEPVLIVTAAAIALTALSDALSQGLDLDTALLAMVQAVVGWLLRETVVPMRKVTSGEFVIVEPEPPLEPPVLGDGD